MTSQPGESVFHLLLKALRPVVVSCDDRDLLASLSLRQVLASSGTDLAVLIDAPKVRLDAALCNTIRDLYNLPLNGLFPGWEVLWDWLDRQYPAVPTTRVERIEVSPHAVNVSLSRKDGERDADLFLLCTTGDTDRLMSLDEQFEVHELLAAALGLPLEKQPPST